MSIKVRTSYFGNFNIPQICIGCGGGPIVSHLKVQKEQQSGNRKSTLTLGFPLCQECDELNSRKFGNVPRTIFFVGILLTILGFILPIVFGSAEENSQGWILGILIGVVVLTFTAVASSLLHKNMDFTSEEREKLKQIKHSVKITEFQQPGLLSPNGRITFKFENHDFADLFSQMNAGQIIGGMK